MTLDIDKVIKDNFKLITRFSALATCNDYIYDTRHRWFYSMVSYDDIQSILPYISQSDIEQDLYLYTVTLAQHYRGSAIEFHNHLKQALGWYLRDHLKHLKLSYDISIEYSNTLETISKQQNADFMPDIEWVINSDILSAYERYIVYLSLYKCYNINEISKIVYQERSTVRKVLKTSTSKLRSYYG